MGTVYCPFVGGKAVYQARALLYFETNTLIYDDDALCDASIGSRYSEENLPQYTLYPNPADKSFNIKYSDSFGDNADLIIEDLSGRWLKQVNLPAKFNIKQLDVSDLPNGLYMIKVLSEGKCIFNQKLVLIR